MRFLLDENLSPKLSALLIAAGHDTIHVRDLDMRSASDSEVIAIAASDERILISADTDFGMLLAQRHAAAPSVILIRRVANRRAAEQARLILDNLPTVHDELINGAVVVLGGQTIRIRSLPI